MVYGFNLNDFCVHTEECIDFSCINYSDGYIKTHLVSCFLNFPFKLLKF